MGEEIVELYQYESLEGEDSHSPRASSDDGARMRIRNVN